MKKLIGCGALLVALVSGAPAFGAEGQGGHTEHHQMGIAMSDDSMQAMHENMAELRAELESMHNADSSDAKLKMMEKCMDGMTQHMQMMMDAMEGKKSGMHNHQMMKK